MCYYYYYYYQMLHASLQALAAEQTRALDMRHQIWSHKIYVTATSVIEYLQVFAKYILHY